MSNGEYFNVGKWHGALVFASGNFSDFKSYMTSESAVSVFLSELKMIGVDDDGKIVSKQLGNSHLASSYAGHMRESLSDSLMVHANMLIVTAGAYFENIIFDFFKLLFINKPKKMHLYIGAEESQGHIKIGDIFEYSDLEAFTADMACRAAKKASDGAPTKILERIEKLSGGHIASDLKKKLTKLVLLRNEIAHEIKRYDLDVLDIEQTYEALEELLRTLGGMAKSLKIPVYDPGGLNS